MNVEQSYNIWAEQYDTNENKTRDLEAYALRENLSQIDFAGCVEIGCGTGKNTGWLITRAHDILAIDISEKMLAAAKKKIQAERVIFRRADINQPWDFVTKQYELVTFSLVLEHIENLDHVFKQATDSIVPGGYVYVGELHPFKQYSGTKARFDTGEKQHIVACFTHNISDFIRSAERFGLKLISLNEYFDNDDRDTVPRILALLFRKI